MAKADKTKSFVKFMIPVGKVSHPHVFKAQAIEEGAQKYFSLEILVDKKKHKLSSLQAPLKEAARAKWGDDQEDWPALTWPIKDGDKPQGKGKKKKLRPEAKGCWIVKAACKEEKGAPAVVGPDKEPLVPSDLYAGCFARASVAAYAYENTSKDGVSFWLDGVQKYKDGKPLSGKPTADQMFGTLEDDEESFDDEESEESFDDGDEEF